MSEARPSMLPEVVASSLFLQSTIPGIIECAAPPASETLRKSFSSHFHFPESQNKLLLGVQTLTRNPPNFKSSEFCIPSLTGVGLRNDSGDGHGGAS